MGRVGKQAESFLFGGPKETAGTSSGPFRL
jgi:hypothetical protein